MEKTSKPILPSITSDTVNIDDNLRNDSLKGLEEKGCITVKRRKKSNKDNETNLYTLMINKPAGLITHTSPDIDKEAKWMAKLGNKLSYQLV